MKNFSSPKHLHELTSRSKSDEKECKYVSYASSTLSKNFTPHPHALVKRAEKIKALLSRFNGHTNLGRLGEYLLQAELQSQDWGRVELAGEKLRGDISAVHPKTGEIVYFEVKTAKRGSQGGWQFCLNKANKTSCSHSDFVFFIVVDEHGAIYRYLVPSAFLGRITQVSISSHPTAYKGKLAAFRLRSEAIDIYQANEIYQLGAMQ